MTRGRLSETSLADCVCLHPIVDHGQGIDSQTGEERWPCDWCGCPDYQENR